MLPRKGGIENKNTDKIESLFQTKSDTIVNKRQRENFLSCLIFFPAWEILSIDSKKYHMCNFLTLKMRIFRLWKILCF